MIRRPWFGWLAAALPAILGTAAWALYFVLSLLPDHVLYFRVSLGYVLLAAGLAVSAIAFGVLALLQAQRRRASLRLQTAQADAAERRRQFLRRLDHELKNPLTTLSVEASGLDADLPPVERAQILLRLRLQVTRLNDLLQQLRKLADLETRPIESEPVDLAQLLRELIDEMQAGDGNARRVELSVPQAPWPLSHVRGDVDLLYLAFRNVLANAFKYSGPQALIQVRAFEDDRQVIVEIADTGPGIPEDELPHVWDELFRGQAARREPGSGLGLALVKAIIERHGGQAAMRSRAGQGAVVTLRFPIYL